MASILRLRFLKSYIDRHGRVRHYVRRPGHKLVPLPRIPGSEEFMASYASALDAAPKPTTQIGATRTRPGSINAMIIGYTSSADFHRLAQATQEQYQRIFERLRREHGDRSVATLRREHVVLMVDAKAKTPVAARDFLRCLRLPGAVRHQHRRAPG
jgi:hypothetical protein